MSILELILVLSHALFTRQLELGRTTNPGRVAFVLMS